MSRRYQNKTAKIREHELNKESHEKYIQNKSNPKKFGPGVHSNMTYERWIDGRLKFMKKRIGPYKESVDNVKKKLI